MKKFPFFFIIFILILSSCSIETPESTFERIERELYETKNINILHENVYCPESCISKIEFETRMEYSKVQELMKEEFLKETEGLVIDKFQITGRRFEDSANVYLEYRMIFIQDEKGELIEPREDFVYLKRIEERWYIDVYKELFEHESVE